MYAVRFHRQGGVDALQYEQIETPPVAPQEVLIRVHACGVNRLDLKAREDRPEVTPMPHILGSDVAGEVVEVEGSSSVSVGARVLVYPCIACGVCEDCFLGDDPLCEHQKVFGFQTQGGYAEYVAAPVSHVLQLSDSVSYFAAASLPIAYLTAWRMLMARAKLQPGEDVLVHAAGSGVGSAAIQIAKLAGARIFTTVGTDWKLAKAMEFGADIAVNYQQQDFAEVVLRHTDGRGVDVVLDHVGEATWNDSLRVLAKRGRLVSCGVTAGNQGSINIRQMYQKQWQIMGSALGNRAELQALLKLAAQGKLQPVIDSVFPLRDAAEAHQRMMDRQQFGKIILDCTQ